VLAEHLLQGLGRLGEDRRGLPERRGDGLGRVPEPFRGLADLVVPLVAMPQICRRTGRDQGLDPLVRFPDPLGQDNVGAAARQVGERRVGNERFELFDQQPVPLGVEGDDQLVVRLAMVGAQLDLDQGRDRTQHQLVGFGGQLVEQSHP
jgi:hypothetical protein